MTVTMNPDEAAHKASLLKLLDDVKKEIETDQAHSIALLSINKANNATKTMVAGVHNEIVILGAITDLQQTFMANFRAGLARHSAEVAEQEKNANLSN